MPKSGAGLTVALHLSPLRSTWWTSSAWPSPHWRWTPPRGPAWEWDERRCPFPGSWGQWDGTTSASPGQLLQPGTQSLDLTVNVVYVYIRWNLWTMGTMILSLVENFVLYREVFSLWRLRIMKSGLQSVSFIARIFPFCLALECQRFYCMCKHSACSWIEGCPALPSKAFHSPYIVI